MKLVRESDFPELSRDSRSGIWYVRKTYRGNTLFKTTGESKNKARAKKIAMRIISEWMGKPFRGYIPSFDDMADEYLRLKRTKSKATQENAFIMVKKHLCPFFGRYSIDEITEAHWEEYVVEKQIERAGIALFNHWKHLVGIMGHAFRKGHIARKYEIKNPDKRESPGKVFSQEEIDSLLAASTYDLFLQILMGLQMGMRKGEILGLAWDRVDLEKGLIRLGKEDTKIRRARTFAISEVVWILLKVRSFHKASPFVFPSRNNKRVASRSNKSAWRTCKRLAGVKGRFHDLRHTFLSNALLRDKKNPIDVAIFAGVSLEEMQKTYLHPTPEDTRYVAEHIRGNLWKEKVTEGEVSETIKK